MVLSAVNKSNAKKTNKLTEDKNNPLKYCLTQREAKENKKTKMRQRKQAKQQTIIPNTKLFTLSINVLNTPIKMQRLSG